MILQSYNYEKIETIAVSFIFSEFLFGLPFQSCPLLAVIRSMQSALFHYYGIWNHGIGNTITLCYNLVPFHGYIIMVVLFYNRILPKGIATSVPSVINDHWHCGLVVSRIFFCPVLYSDKHCTEKSLIVSNRHYQAYSYSMHLERANIPSMVLHQLHHFARV